MTRPVITPPVRVSDPQRMAEPSRFEDLTVTSISPLRVIRTGDDEALPFTPDAMIDTSPIQIGDRVRCEWDGGRVVIHGVEGGVGYARPGVGGIPYRMAAGTVSFSMSGQSVTGVTITLPASRFTHNPLPFVNLLTGVGNSQKDVPRIYSASTSALTAGIWTGDQTSATSHTAILSWLAVQMLEGAAAG